MDFRFAYKTKIVAVEMGAAKLQLETLESLDDTIDEFFAEYERTKQEELFEDLCPYFGVLWPAGVALARYLEQNPAIFREKKQILEIGCGLALPSLYLGKLEIPVLAMDIHPDVPVFFARNCERNAIRSIRCEQKDWRCSMEGEYFDLILGSDILYDRYQPAALVSFLQNHLAATGTAIFADPGRPYLEGFLKLLREQGWQVGETLYEDIFLLRINAAR